MASLQDNLSIDSFGVETTGSSLYFLTNEWKWIPERKLAAGDWEGLYRFDLSEHRVERLMGKGDLRLPDGVDRTWLCEILTPGNGGRHIFCRAALMKKQDTKEHVDYWICDLNLAEIELTPIARLENAFA